MGFGVKFSAALSLLFLSFPAQAADLSITPLNDNNSIRTHIAIPFSTKTASGTGGLQKVQVLNKSSCKTLIDPYIASNFFLKCSQAESVSLKVTYASRGSSFTITYGPINVRNLSDDGTVVGDDSAPSAEWLLGQTLWSKTTAGRMACASCHGSAASKASAISTTSLNAAYANTIMSTQAITLTDDEKKAVITFVKSYK